MRAAAPQIGVSEMARVSGLSPRRIRALVREVAVLRDSCLKGEGRGAKVTVARAAFNTWMESRRLVRDPVPA